MQSVNPIVLDEVADPEMHRERVVQNVLVTWLRFYFSGNTFQTRSHDGTMLAMTFPDCEIGAEEMVLPDPLVKPFIHYYHLSQKERVCSLAQHDLYIEDHRIVLDVSVPVSLPSAMAGALPVLHVRRIADHAAWLFRSDERTSLSESGIMRVRVVKPPTPSIAPDGMLRRSMVIDFEHHSRVNRPREI